MRFWVLFAGLACLLTVSSASAQPHYAISERFEEFSRLLSLQLGDFNEDGADDIVGTLERTYALRVRVSDDRGRFIRTTWHFAAGMNRSVVADLNVDGHLDLLTGALQDNPCCDPREFLFHPGDGTGDHTGQQVFGTGILARSVTALDANGDLLPDVVVSDGASLEVYLNDGATFVSPPVTTDLGGLGLLGSMERFGVGHVDGDANLDLVALHGGGVLFLLGDGSGGFLPVLYPVQIGNGSIDVGDVNEDGLVDVVFVPQAAGNTARVLLSDGLGGGTEVDLTGDLAGIRSFSIKDFDGDSNLDVVVAEHQVSTFLGDGQGAFSRGPSVAAYNIVDMAVGDLDGDGVTDVLTTNSTDFFLDVFFGKKILGTGEPAQVLGARGRNADVVSGDFNEDGIVDLAWESDEVWLALGLGGGEFAPAASLLALDGRALEVGDFDGDDHQDLLLVATDSLEVLFGDGQGAFPQTVTTSALDNQERVLVADVNNDGQTDVFLRQGWIPMVFVSTGRNPFTPQELLQTALEYEPQYRAAGDLNNDGNVDVILRRRMSDPGAFNRLSVARGNGTGSFEVIQHMDGGGDDLGLHDLTGDGVLDLVVEGNRVRPGLGWGAFDDPVLRTDLLGGSDFLLSDINGDGLVDFVSRENVLDRFNVIGKNLRVQLGEESGDFAPATYLGIPTDNQRYFTEDLNQDGQQDFVLTHGDPSIWLVFNRTRLVNCRKGTINTAVGDPVDVLQINGQTGDGDDRLLILDPTDPMTIFLDRPPSGGSSYVMYAWVGCPSLGTVSDLRFGLGAACMPFVMNNPVGGLRPVAIWNTFQGFDDLLGEATFNSQNAPDVLISLPSIDRTGRFYVQGLMVDGQSEHGQAGITNGIEVLVR